MGGERRTPDEVIARLLARREHSRSELLAKLAARGFETPACEAALDEFAARGWQSDLRYAVAYIAERLARGYGPLKIKGELRQRGVAAADIAAALAELAPDWGAAARAALARCRHTEPAARRGWLERRGFTAAECRLAITVP